MRDSCQNSDNSGISRNLNLKVTDLEENSKLMRYLKKGLQRLIGN